MIRLLEINNASSPEFLEAEKKLSLALQPFIKKINEKYPDVDLEFRLMERFWLPPKTGLRSIIIIFAAYQDKEIRVEISAEDLAEKIELAAEKAALEIESKIKSARA